MPRVDQVAEIDSNIAVLESETHHQRLQRADELGRLSSADLIAIGADLSTDWLSDQYAVNDAALKDMGFSDEVRATDVPTLKEVQDALSDQTIAWLNGHRAAGSIIDLAIRPRVQDIGLVGAEDEPGLIPRFDNKQTHPTEVGPIWNLFDDKDPLHDNSETEAWSAGFMLGDKVQPDEPDGREEPGLVYRLGSWEYIDKQRLLLSREKAAHQAYGRELAPAVIADIVVINAQRRVEGKPLLDQGVPTRLTHYPDCSPVSVGLRRHFDHTIPTVKAKGDRLELSYDFVQNSWPRGGARRILRLALES